jgi:hypothetical protein
MTNTPLYPLRIDAATRKALNDIAAAVVPDEAMEPNAAHNASRVPAMLRMIARGELLVARIVSQRLINYRQTVAGGALEAVVESTCLMSDGSEEVQYAGYRDNGRIDYGTRCPTIDKVKEEASHA